MKRDENLDNKILFILKRKDVDCAVCWYLRYKYPHIPYSDIKVIVPQLDRDKKRMYQHDF